MLACCSGASINRDEPGWKEFVVPRLVAVSAVLCSDVGGNWPLLCSSYRACWASLCSLALLLPLLVSLT